VRAHTFSPPRLITHRAFIHIREGTHWLTGWARCRKAKSKQTTDDGAGDVVSAFLDRVQESMQLHPMWAALSPFELRKARDDLQHHIFTRLYKQYDLPPHTHARARVLPFL
jgi:hypothetical protein